MRRTVIILFGLVALAAWWLSMPPNSGFDLGEYSTSEMGISTENNKQVNQAESLATAEAIQNAVFPDQLKPLFDQFLLHYEQGEQAVWRAFRQYCADNAIGQEEQAEITDLLKRYLDYKQQLAAFDTPISNADLETVEERLELLAGLRQQHFDSLEIKRLFAEEHQYDAFAVERLRLLSDPQLTDMQKMNLLQEQVNQWPEDMRMAIEPTLQLRQIEWLDQHLERATVADAYNQYAAAFGGETAERLVTLQQDELKWQEKIRGFQEEQSKLANLYQDKSQLIDAVEALKQSMFTASEQKRLTVFLAEPELITN